MINKILILLIFILININLLDLILIKWNIDYFIKLKDQCKIIKNEVYEIETYKYNIINYIYNIDKKDTYNNIQKRFESIYKINIYIIIILLIIEIKYFFEKKETKYKLVLILLVLYFYVGYFVVKEKNKIIELKKKKNTINKYYKIYKILNILLIYNENYKKIKYKKKTLNDIIKKNISNIYKTHSDLEIDLIKQKSIDNKDIAKFLILENKDFIENIYIMIDNDNIVYVKNINKYSYIYDKIFDDENVDSLKKDENFEYNNEIDYITYFNENKYILLTSNFNTENNEIENILKNNTYILITLLIVIVIFINISHYLFKKINNSLYGLILFIIILIYILFIWLKLK